METEARHGGIGEQQMSLMPPLHTLLFTPSSSHPPLHPTLFTLIHTIIFTHPLRTLPFTPSPSHLPSTPPLHTLPSTPHPPHLPATGEQQLLEELHGADSRYLSVWGDAHLGHEVGQWLASNELRSERGCELAGKLVRGEPIARLLCDALMREAAIEWHRVRHVT
jgi:hypothetical protein